MYVQLAKKDLFNHGLGQVDFAVTSLEILSVCLSVCLGKIFKEISITDRTVTEEHLGHRDAAL